MPRNRVSLALIDSPTKRKMSYERRVMSLVKKAEELSTLCGVMVCSIAFGPSSPMTMPPTAWATPPGIQAVLEHYHQHPPTGKLKKMTNQTKFIGELIAKVIEKVKKQQGLNKAREITDMMLRYLMMENNNRVHELSCTHPSDLHDLDQEVDRHLSEINNKIMNIINLQQYQPPLPPPPSPAAPAAADAADDGGRRMEDFSESWMMGLLPGLEDYDFVSFGGNVQLPSFAPNDYP